MERAALFFLLSLLTLELAGATGDQYTVTIHTKAIAGGDSGDDVKFTLKGTLGTEVFYLLPPDDYYWDQGTSDSFTLTMTQSIGDVITVILEKDLGSDNWYMDWIQMTEVPSGQTHYIQSGGAGTCVWLNPDNPPDECSYMEYTADNKKRAVHIALLVQDKRPGNAAVVHATTARTPIECWSVCLANGGCNAVNVGNVSSTATYERTCELVQVIYPVYQSDLVAATGNEFYVQRQLQWP